MKVRAYTEGEMALTLKQGGEFSRYIGYVISGRILFLNAEQKPLGIAIKDEFVLGRPFSIQDSNVTHLLSGQEGTFIVFIPKETLAILSGASSQFAEMFEEIYESIFERARIIASDAASYQKIQDWIKHTTESDKTLSPWLLAIEKKRLESAERRIRNEENRKIIQFSWFVGIAAIIFVAFYAYMHRGDFKAGNSFNVNIGIIGFILILLTNLHTILVCGMRNHKWKINYQVSQNYHIFFGVCGAVMILFHSAFQLKGVNVAHFAIYAMGLGLLSGFIGQFISNQIPKTIRGEKMKLDSLKGEQKKLQAKAEMLMENEGMYKTSVALISQGIPTSFWGNFFAAPQLWYRRFKLKQTLKELGLSKNSADLAADLVKKEFQMRQKVRMLEMSDVFFRKWMLIHKPLGYLVYVLAIIHIIWVSVVI